MRKLLPFLTLLTACTSAPASQCTPDPAYASCPVGSAYLCGDSVACCTDATCDDPISPADHCSLAPQLDSACDGGTALTCDDGLRCVDVPACRSVGAGTPACGGSAVEWACVDGRRLPGCADVGGSDSWARSVFCGGAEDQIYCGSDGAPVEAWCCPA